MGQSTALVNLDPLWGFVGLGAMLATLPLAWWAMRSSGATPLGRWQALAMITLFLTFDLVLFGSFTRLTDSGLGCPDWPGCYGSVTAWGAKEHIDAAQAAMPHGPVTTSKAWIEMIHRKMATVIGALITLLMGLAFYWRKHLPFSPMLAVGTFVWVCIQGAFGALTVTWKLFPAIVTLHLLGGMLLLVLLTHQVARNALQLGQQVCVALPGAVRGWLWIAAALLFVQIALGAWVSTNYAVLACTEFPMCQGQWWPPMSFRDGFTIWHELGKLPSGEQMGMPAVTAIHVVHRSFYFCVAGAFVLLFLKLRHVPAVRKWAHALIGIVGVQFLTGLANVVLGWPLLAALLHVAGAAALVMILTLLLTQTRSGDFPAALSMTDNRTQTPA